MGQLQFETQEETYGCLSIRREERETTISTPCGTGEIERLEETAPVWFASSTFFLFFAHCSDTAFRRTILRAAGTAAGRDAVSGRAGAEARIMQARACIFGAEEAGAGGRIRRDEEGKKRRMWGEREEHRAFFFPLRPREPQPQPQSPPSSPVPPRRHQRAKMRTGDAFHKRETVSQNQRAR